MNKPGKDKPNIKLDWRSDEVSDEEFCRGFDEHFSPGLSDNPLWVKSEWDEAFQALSESPNNPDLLAIALRHSHPPPKWVCVRLSDMISSGAKPNENDQFVFSRTPALRRKMKTNEQRIRAGAAYFAARAKGKTEAESFTDALDEVDYRDESFARKARALFNKLPDYLKRRALGARK